MWQGMRRDLLFQSPLRRGSVFISENFGHSRKPENLFQSPLRRGSVFINEHRRNQGTASLTFQSPLRRGSVFILILVNTNLPAMVSVNPLFVGEVSSSFVNCSVHVADDKFQSPLRRGSVFIRQYYVSVIGAKCMFPSPLRRGSVFILTLRNGQRSTGCFNPLFVGEVSSSGSISDPSLNLYLGFNPLFVREVSSSWISLTQDMRF